MAYMSQEGYDKLVAELKQLVSVERPKASAAIAEARDKGDLSENSEYDAAKEAQAHLEDKDQSPEAHHCRGQDYRYQAAQHRQRADYVEGRDDQHG